MRSDGDFDYRKLTPEPPGAVDPTEIDGPGFLVLAKVSTRADVSAAGNYTATARREC